MFIRKQCRTWSKGVIFLIPHLQPKKKKEHTKTPYTIFILGRNMNCLDIHKSEEENRY